MARPFNKLRARMMELGVQQRDLVRELNLGISSISRRMSGAEEWKLSEIWQVIRMLQIPEQRMHEYFPDKGINEPGVFRGKRAV